MLILTRKSGEAINIGDAIKVIVIEIKGNAVKIGIEAPRTLSVYRSELYAMVQEQNREAVSPDITLAECMGYFLKREEKK